MRMFHMIAMIAHLAQLCVHSDLGLGLGKNLGIQALLSLSLPLEPCQSVQGAYNDLQTKNTAKNKNKTNQTNTKNQNQRRRKTKTQQTQTTHKRTKQNKNNKLSSSSYPHHRSRGPQKIVLGRQLAVYSRGAIEVGAPRRQP